MSDTLHAARASCVLHVPACASQASMLLRTAGMPFIQHICPPRARWRCGAGRLPLCFRALMPERPLHSWLDLQVR